MNSSVGESEWVGKRSDRAWDDAVKAHGEERDQSAWQDENRQADRHTQKRLLANRAKQLSRRMRKGRHHNLPAGW